MKKQIVILISLVVTLFLGVSAFLVIQISKGGLPNLPWITKNLEGSQINSKREVNAPKDDELSLTGTVLDIYQTGKTLKCTYSADDDGVTSSGTTYISGTKVRSDFEVEMEEGVSSKGHMIFVDSTAYTWTEGMNPGYKMTLSLEDLEGDKGNIQSNKDLEVYAKAYDFKCTPWIVDTSVFEVPTDISFTDFTEMLDTFQTVDEPSELAPTGDLCAVCDLSPDEETKLACRQGMGCVSE